MQYVLVPGTTFEFEFVAPNLTFAVVRQIALFFNEQFKLIMTMVEIINRNRTLIMLYFDYLNLPVKHFSC